MPDAADAQRPIGVFDSGIGGLSVLRALRAELPHEDFIYIADNAHAPYGERDDAHVIARSRALAAMLAERRIKALVVACNTATAAAIHLLRQEAPSLPIVGIEPALKPAIQETRTGRIGVMATRGTLASRKFEALLHSLAGQAQFVLQPCDGLADAIERSVLSNDQEVAALCERHVRALGPMGDAPGCIDTIVLGCTHYPFAAARIAAAAGARVRLIDPSEPVARRTRQLLAAAGQLRERTETGTVSLQSTGDPSALRTAAAAWLGIHATSAN